MKVCQQIGLGMIDDLSLDFEGKMVSCGIYDVVYHPYDLLKFSFNASILQTLTYL